MDPSRPQPWAKTDPDSGSPALTVRDHCLIVGSVAEAILARLAPDAAGLAPPGTATIAALHDIGKISPGFQRKCPLVAQRYPAIPRAEDNHAKLGQGWIESLEQLRDSDRRSPAWALALGAHHGRYVPQAGAELIRYFREEVRAYPEIGELREALLDELSNCFGPLSTEPVGRHSAALHWLTGLVTFADWVGSNTDWFPLLGSGELRDVWTPDEARHAAEKAVGELGWHRSAVTAQLGFGDLFAPLSNGESLSPRPLQSVLIAAADRPGLYIVEAPMGMGKTEAALAAAYRRWNEGGERGLYFALPTQLTSNRIHNRIVEFLDKIVADADSVQALVHGNAWLFPDRIRALKPTHGRAEGDATDAHAWFASGRRALLAPFGTGTIDQALMAVMAAKHSALRLFALAGKAVVIDEVHSYDPYTSALVDQLVKHLLDVGCSVFVLSATLTARRRSELVTAAGATLPGEMPDDYPLITRVVRGETLAEPIRVVGESPVPVAVRLERRLPDAASTREEIADAAEAGACVLVIRNTVKSAQETYRHLKSLVRERSGIEIGLLHSRFTFLDRLCDETKWMKKLGRDGRERPKRGAILVATQVVEQSVDIDADLLVTDLAPVDLGIQRLGRLHRHARGWRPSGFEQPRCLILVPEVDWSGDEKSIKSALGPSAWVYPPFALYQAERLLANRESVVLPTGIRALLEASDVEPQNLPDGAQRFAEELLVKHRDMALSAARQGWLDAATLPDTEGTKTRWGAQRSGLVVLLAKAPIERGGRTTVVLADGTRYDVRPGEFCYPLAKSLHENAIRVPRYLVGGSVDGQSPWLRNHIEDAVAMVRSVDSLALVPLGAESATYEFIYSKELGLGYTKSERIPLPFEPEEDFWY